MDLHSYLSRPGSPAATDLARQIDVNPDQIRHWRHGYAGRRPSPEMCVQIEQATGGAVARWDLRPDDWHRIWPELVNAEGAPPTQPAQAQE